MCFLVLVLFEPVKSAEPPIRFGNLESAGIGHFSLPIEIYLAEVECGINNSDRVFDIWYLDKIICNSALKKKWDKHLTILPRFLIQPLHLLNRTLPGGKGNEIPYRRIEDYSDYKNPWQSIDIHDVLKKTRPKIKFTEEENLNCSNRLKKTGFDPSKKYVCLNIRDGAFHSDADLASPRNHSVNKYHDAISYLNELGYQVVSLGANVQERLSLEGPYIFEYATSGTMRELLDLFLISKCEFYVGTGSGIDFAANLFRKTQVYIDFSQISTIPECSSISIIIFRKFKIKQQTISMDSIFNKGYDKLMLSHQFKEAGIEFVDNSKEEIRSVIWEAHARLNGSWKDDSCVKDLQDLFKSYFPMKKGQEFMTARIGSDFLKSNLNIFNKELKNE